MKILNLNGKLFPNYSIDIQDISKQYKAGMFVVEMYTLLKYVIKSTALLQHQATLCDYVHIN